MLFQAAYAEMYFPETLFPDFKNEDFDIALDIYNKRDRRFGGVKKWIQVIKESFYIKN